MRPLPGVGCLAKVQFDLGERMKHILKCLPHLFAFLLICASGLAQQQGSITGGLNGVITDSTGASVQGATVTLAGPQGKRILTTDSLGRYSASGLTPGIYSVTVEKANFRKVESPRNEVVVNSSSTLDLTLSIASATDTFKLPPEPPASAHRPP